MTRKSVGFSAKDQKRMTDRYLGTIVMSKRS